MRHLYLLTALFFLLPFFASAQSNYKPGYVVKLNGDTINGFVNYKEWNKNPVKILFKVRVNQKPEELNVNNITGFAINGTDDFKRYTVKISQSQVETENLKPGVDSTFTTNAVFLRTLAIGDNLSFFSYTDDIKTRYYILEKGKNEPQELLYNVFINPRDFGLIQTDNVFQRQLELLAKKYIVNNDEKINARIFSTRYSESDLIKIVQLLNNNINSKFTAKSTLGTRWLVGIGANENGVSFSGLLKFPINYSVAPGVLVGFDLIPNKSIQQIVFRLELSYMVDQHTFPTYAISSNSSYSTSNIIQRTFSFSPQVIYNIYNTKKLQVFVNGGAALNSSSYNNYTLKQTLNGTFSTQISNYPEFTNLWVSLPIKAGVAVNRRFEIYLGYIFSTAITNNNGYSGNITIYQAGINYLFEKK